MPQTTLETPRPALPDEYWEGELIPQSDPRAAVVSVNADRVGGAPCFVGTRVPIRNLWDYLMGGDDIAEFQEGFPGVTAEQIEAVLRLAYERLVERLPDGEHPETASS